MIITLVIRNGKIMANKVINFHDVYDQAWFEKTLLILNKKYNLISIEKLEEFFYDNHKLHNSCLITIDDGDRTFYDVMFPILIKHKIPAILFVSPKITSNNENFWFQEIRQFDEIKLNRLISNSYKTDLSQYPNWAILKTLTIEDIWRIIGEYKMQNKNVAEKHFNINIEQLKEVHASKIVKIGAHTQNHPILQNESDEISKKEITDSIRNLEIILNDKVHYFAYPNGIPSLDFNQREVSFLKENGIKLAFSTESRDFSIVSRPFEIPRYGISLGSEVFIKAKLLLGRHWDTIKKLKTKSETRIRKEIRTKLSLE